MKEKSMLRIRIEKREMIQGLQGAIISAISDYKDMVDDRIANNDFQEVERILYILKNLAKVKKALNWFDKNLTELVGQEEEEENDLGLTSLFG